MLQDAEILSEIRDGIGFITLNRPQALNALTPGMTDEMDRLLTLWAEDAAVRAVVVTGAGGRAFCSGGDVKAVALDGTGVLKRDFFRAEYILNRRIFRFPKPYISLIDGIVMGGGKGISAHGSHRIVSENTLFAMPETSIGFFPDVGGGYFLPRCPGQTGLYLALTSKRIKAIDTLYIGFATHFVESKDFPALTAALRAEKNIDDTIRAFSRPAPATSDIAPYREKIDRFFGHNSIGDIVAALDKDASPWAVETLTALLSMSPVSLKVALRQIRLGAALSFEDVMTMEYRLSQRFMQGRDFYEGIRAVLIDKDRNPRWKPARLDEVSGAEVDSYFQSLGKNDLTF